MIKLEKYIFKHGDTIEGVLKNKSNMELKIAKKLFFSVNNKKIYKLGEIVKIPILLK